MMKNQMNEHLQLEEQVIKGLISGDIHLELPKSKRLFKFKANGKNYLSRDQSLRFKVFPTLQGMERGLYRITPNVVAGGETHKRILTRLVEFIWNLKKREKAPDHLVENPGKLFTLVNDACSSLNFPTMNGLLVRKDLKLPLTVPDGLLAWARSLISLHRGRVKLYPLRINKGSVSGYPFFVKGEDKVGLVYYGFEHLDNAVEAYNKRDISFLSQNALLGVFTGNIRRTNPSIKISEDCVLPIKARDLTVSNKQVVSYESMLDIGRGGDNLKMVDIDYDSGITSSPFRFRRNSRLIMANNISVNAYAQPADSFTQSFIKSFDLAYVSNCQDFEQRMKGFNYYVAYDFSTFDATNSGGLISVLYDEFLSLYFSEEYLTMLKMLRASPFLCIKIGSNPVRLVGEFFNDSLKTSLMSGWYLVAGEGKFTAFIVASYLLHCFTGEDMDTILNNKSNYFRAFSMSDDFISAWKDEKTAKLFKQFIERELRRNNVFYNLKFEEPAKYLGPYYVNGRYNYGVVRLCESLLLPERGFDNKAYPKLSLQEKLKLFDLNNSQNLYSEEVRDELVKIYLEESGEDLRKLDTVFAGYDISELNLSPIEAEVLNEPTKINWKFVEGLDESFIEHFYTTIPSKTVLEYIKPYLKSDTEIILT